MTMIMKSLDDLWPFCIVLCVGVALAAFTLLVLACQIIWPNIVTYPWKENEEQIDTTVIFAASYNPPHFGHIQILEYLSKRYSKVIAVVGFNPDKKYLVTPKERAALLREMLKSITAKNIEVVVVEGYIWRYAKQKGVDAKRFIRGIRSWEKDGKDERKLQILNTWGPLFLGSVFPIKTIYIEGDPKYNHVSSTLIREICSSDTNRKSKEEALSKLVPTNMAGNVTALYEMKN